jgi:hypothetical protein
VTPERKDFIYNRLLEIDIKVEVLGIPDPRYLNEKIGACHVLIEEVERYSIETYRELSILQQAVNNAIADYETKRETSLSQNTEIRALPNIKDREARVNACLRTEQGVIRKYKNDVLALEHLLKALNLKAKNLNSKNGDIKSHIKIMESQIKLNSTSASDPAARSLMDEFRKSRINKDSFENAMGSVTESDSTDPSTPIDINNLLAQGNDGEDLPAIEPKESEASDVDTINNLPKQEPVPETLLNPDPVLDPENNGESIEEEDNGPEILDDVVLDESSVEENIPEITPTETVIDLDQIIDLNNKPKGGALPQIKEPAPEPAVKKQAASDIKPDPVITKKETTKSSGLDLDALLDELQTTKGVI